MAESPLFFSNPRRAFTYLALGLNIPHHLLPAIQACLPESARYLVQRYLVFERLTELGPLRSNLLVASIHPDTALIAQLEHPLSRRVMLHYSLARDNGQTFYRVRTGNSSNGTCNLLDDVYGSTAFSKLQAHYQQTQSLLEVLDIIVDVFDPKYFDWTATAEGYRLTPHSNKYSRMVDTFKLTLNSLTTGFQIHCSRAPSLVLSHSLSVSLAMSFQCTYQVCRGALAPRFIYTTSESRQPHVCNDLREFMAKLTSHTGQFMPASISKTQLEKLLHNHKSSKRGRDSSPKRSTPTH